MRPLATVDLDKRARQAIASRLIHTSTLLTAQRRYLQLLKHSLDLEAGMLGYLDAEASRRLAKQIADYYRAEGHVIRRVERLYRLSGALPLSRDG